MVAMVQARCQRGLFNLDHEWPNLLGPPTTRNRAPVFVPDYYQVETRNMTPGPGPVFVPDYYQVETRNSTPVFVPDYYQMETRNSTPVFVRDYYQVETKVYTVSL